MRVLRPGQRVTLAELDGPGTITHLWTTFDTLPFGASPTTLRAQVLEVFYDDLAEPSVSVPAPDFFGAVHGLPVPYASALTAVNEGRGYVSRIPMPFRRAVRIEWCNASPEPVILYYQADLLGGPIDDDAGILHACYRRDNPTVPLQDFVVVDGARGPGRFLGWTGGVRILDSRHWWGEGEVKIFLDDDGDRPTICGTGTEDYFDSAWGLGTFQAPETGAPLVLAAEDGPAEAHRFAAFYRWHLSDPIVFDRSLRVTIQQIGSAQFGPGDDLEYQEFRAAARPAGRGWFESGPPGDRVAFGLYERSDDWCATSFVYCRDPYAVARVDVGVATADLPASRSGYRSVHRSDAFGPR
jgi:Protein of unknown function (DUF2961)